MSITLVTPPGTGSECGRAVRSGNLGIMNVSTENYQPQTRQCTYQPQRDPFYHRNRNVKPIKPIKPIKLIKLIETSTFGSIHKVYTFET